MVCPPLWPLKNDSQVSIQWHCPYFFLRSGASGTWKAQSVLHGGGAYATTWPVGARQLSFTASPKPFRCLRGKGWQVPLSCHCADTIFSPAPSVCFRTTGARCTGSRKFILSSWAEHPRKGCLYEGVPPLFPLPTPVSHWRSIINPIERVIHAQATSIMQCAQCPTVNYDIIYEEENDDNNNNDNKAQGTTPVSGEPLLDLSDLSPSWKGGLFPAQSEAHTSLGLSGVSVGPADVAESSSCPVALGCRAGEGVAGDGASSCGRVPRRAAPPLPSLSHNQK